MIMKGHFSDIFHCRIRVVLVLLVGTLHIFSVRNAVEVVNTKIIFSSIGSVNRRIFQVIKNAGARYVFISYM